jgi:hypothetical protein
MGFCLLGLTLLRSAHVRRPTTPSVRAWPRPPRLPGSRALEARRAAWHCWVRAELAVNEQRYALEAWDPAADALFQSEGWRRQQMEADPNGQLRQAWAWARRAAALSGTPADQHASAELLTHLAYETGRCEEERRDARRLIQLAPRDPIARLLWQKAIRDR